MVSNKINLKEVKGQIKDKDKSGKRVETQRSFTLLWGSCVQDMLQQYNRIKFSLSAANRMKIKSLTHNRTIAKCFSLDEKHFWFHYYVLWYSFIFQYFDFVFDLLFKQRVEICTLTNFETFKKIYPVSYFVVEIRKGPIHLWRAHGRDVWRWRWVGGL